MANRSFLCATDMRTLHPSFVEKPYDSDQQTVATDVYCIPLLWTALFRPGDIVCHTFEAEGQQVYTEAPLAERSKALAQLEDAIPWFNELFQKEGALDEYGAFLKQAIEAVPYKYLTIELQEIACMSDEKKYYDSFRGSLGSIGNSMDKATKGLFVKIAQFRKLKRFPPARLLLDGLEASEKDDFWNHCRICGAGANVGGIGRPVPWEPA